MMPHLLISKKSIISQIAIVETVSHINLSHAIGIYSVIGHKRIPSDGATVEATQAGKGYGYKMPPISYG
jgi:hypothetical protein